MGNVVVEAEELGPLIKNYIRVTPKLHLNDLEDAWGVHRSNISVRLNGNRFTLPELIATSEVLGLPLAVQMGDWLIQNKVEKETNEFEDVKRENKELRKRLALMERIAELEDQLEQYRTK